MALRLHPKITSIFASTCALLVTACNNAPVVTPVTAPVSADGQGKKSSVASLGSDPHGEVQPGVEPSAANPPTPDPDTPIEYPSLALNGTGQVVCKDSLASTTKIVTTMSATQLAVQRTAIDVQCYEGGFLGIGSCDKQAFMQQVQSQAIGTTTYDRPTAAAMRGFRNAGKDLPDYAIYADKITASSGATYVFDSPLPIFPFPHSAASYKALEEKSAVFTAQMSGAKTGQVQVVVSLQGAAGDQVKMTIEVTLNGGDMNHTTYDKFPMPKSATYTIDTLKHDLLGMQSSDWFDDSHCSNNGVVNMNYGLCTKTTGGKVENYACPTIQPLN